MTDMETKKIDGSTNVERDTVSRNRIVSETDKNFFVEAGAGSGKTTMLVSRMVAMVEAGIDISKICAITFTKAAAGEFYDRFQKLLIERSNPDYKWVDKGFAGQLGAPTKESRELCAKALQNIDLCFMGTIDSFCSMVLSEHPSEAGIPSDAMIMSDMDAQSLYKQIYVKICDGAYGEDLKNLARAFRVLHYNAADVFVSGEMIFMNNRNVHFNFERSSIVDIDKEFADDKEKINKALKCLLEHPELKYEGTKTSVAAWEKLPDITKKLARKWSNNFPRVIKCLKDLQDLRVVPEAMDKYAPFLIDCFEPGGKQGKWLDFTPSQPGGLFDKVSNLRYQVSMTFLSECIPVIEEEMRNKGAMTFFDYLYYLRNMLKKDAKNEGKLIRYIYDRHSYFLIDEFQDTNPMQAEVFFYLSSEHPVEQWDMCVPRPGSLFIVGDPKQSIYRFRGADVTSFLKVKKLFEANGGDILYLSRNFRSTKQIIEYFNEVFTNILPEETDVQSKFEEIPLPSKDSDEFQGIYKYTAYSGKVAEDCPDETDPCQIRKIIQKIVGNEKYQISRDGELRPVKYSDIMIITYGKSKISGIVEELDSVDIPTKVEGNVPFEKNQALYEIFFLYNAVADTSDKNALFDALTSNLFGICEPVLMQFRKDGGEISLNSENALGEDIHELSRYVAGQIAKIKTLAKKASRLSPAALFAEIMDGFEIYRIADAENLEVLYYTLELMRNAEKTGLIVSLKDGANYIAKLLRGESDEERCLSLNDSKDCVHIANLHKVKGLEAPVVILAAATQFASGVSLRIVHDGKASEGYVFSVDSEKKDGSSYPYFSTTDFHSEKEDEKYALDAEHQRLIYVGATRVRNALIICDSLCPVGKSIAHKSIWKELLNKCNKDIFEVTKDDLEVKAPACDVENAVTLYEKAKDECVLNSRLAECSSYKIVNPSHARISSKISDEGRDVVVAAEIKEAAEKEGVKSRNDVHRFPALLGTMTHKLMEMIVSTKNTFDIKEAVDEIIREYRTPQNEPFEGKLAKALIEVANVMQNGGYEQNNALPKDILKVLLGADEVYCEVPFCYKDLNKGEVTVWNGVMDVVYCTSGQWHIVDYKTNIDGNNLDDKYKAQLEAYKKAFKEITGNDADAWTYHIDV